MTRKVTKLHAGECLLKARYLALRDALSDLSRHAPHIGRQRNECAASCPACEAHRALVADAIYGRMTDDRQRKERG